VFDVGDVGTKVAALSGPRIPGIPNAWKHGKDMVRGLVRGLACGLARHGVVVG
jgi:hypothetical protein